MSNELVVACRTGDVDQVIKLLQDPNIDINAPHTETDTTPLFEALSNARLGVVKALITTHRPASSPLNTDNALLFASLCRDAEMKKYIFAFIIEYYAKFKFKDGTTRTHIAAACGDITTCRNVKREELTRSTKYHLTPMYFALINSQESISKLIASKLAHMRWDVVIDGDKIHSYDAKVASYVIDGFSLAGMVASASIFCAFILSKVEGAPVKHLQLLFKKIIALSLQAEKFVVKHEQREDAIINLINDINETLSCTEKSYLREISTELVFELQLLLVRLDIEIEVFITGDYMLKNLMKMALAHKLETKRIEEHSKILNAASELRWSAPPSQKKELSGPEQKQHLLRVLHELSITGDIDKFTDMLPKLDKDEWDTVIGDTLGKAVTWGRVRMLILMIEESLKPHRSRIKSQYLLLHACLCDNPKVREACLKVLFDNYDAIDFSDGTTRVHIAAALGDTKYLRKVKDLKELEASTSYGIKPMFFAMINEQETYQWYMDTHKKRKEFAVMESQDCTFELGLLIGRGIARIHDKSKALIQYTDLLTHLSHASKYQKSCLIKDVVALSSSIEKNISDVGVDLGFNADHFITWLKSILVLVSRLENHAEISELNLILLKIYVAKFRFAEAEELAKTTLRYALINKLNTNEISLVIEKMKKVRNAVFSALSVPSEPTTQQASSLPPPVTPAAKSAPPTIPASPKSTLESIDVDELKNKFHELAHSLELKNKLYELFEDAGFLYKLTCDENQCAIEFTSASGSISQVFELAQIFKNVSSVGIEYDKQVGLLRVMRTNNKGMVDLLQKASLELIEMKKYNLNKASEQFILIPEEIKKWQAELHELFCKAAEVKIKWDQKQQCFIATYDALTWNLAVGKKTAIATVTDDFVENTIVSYIRRHCSKEAYVVMDKNSREIKIFPLSKDISDVKLLQSFIYSRMNLSPTATSQAKSEVAAEVSSEGKDNNSEASIETLTLEDIRSLFSATFGDPEQRFLFLKEKSNCRVYTLYYPYAQVQNSSTIGSINVMINIIRAVNAVVGGTAISIYAFNHNIEIVINKNNLLANFSLAKIEKLNDEYKRLNAIKLEKNIPCPSAMDPASSFDLVQLFYSVEPQTISNQVATLPSPSNRDLDLLILAIRKLDKINRQNFDEILKVLSDCPHPKTFDGTPKKDVYYFSYLYYAMRFFMIISDSLFNHTQFGENNIYRLIRNFIRHDVHDSKNWESYYNWINPLVQRLKVIAPALKQAPTMALFLNAEPLVKREILNDLNAALEPFITQLGNRKYNKNKSQMEKTKLIDRYAEYLLKVKFCGEESDIKVPAELMLRGLSGKITKFGTDAEINGKLGHEGKNQLFSLFTNELRDKYCQPSQPQGPLARTTY